MIYVYWTVFSICMAFIASLFLPKRIESLPTNNSRIVTIKPKLVTKIFLLISFLPYFLLGALRYFVGTDYETYLYNQIPGVLKNQWSGNVAPLYRLVIIFGSKLGSTQWIFVLTSLIIAIFMYLSILNESKSYSMSVFLITFSTFYSFTLNGMRQSIAALIILFGVSFIAKNKMIFLVSCIVGVLFHTSGLLLIVVILISILVEYKINVKVFIFLSPIFYVFAPIVYTLMEDVASKIGYGYYFQTNQYISLDKALVLVLFGSLLIAALVDMQGTTLTKYDQLLVNITGVSILLLIFLRTVPNAGRLVELFLPFQIILIPNLITYIKNGYMRILLRGIIVIVFVILFTYRIFDQNFNEILPFQFVTNWNF